MPGLSSSRHHFAGLADDDADADLDAAIDEVLWQQARIHELATEINRSARAHRWELIYGPWIGGGIMLALVLLAIMYAVMGGG